MNHGDLNILNVGNATLFGTTWLVFGCCRVFGEFLKGLIICEWGFRRKCYVSFLVELDIINLFLPH